MKSSGQEGGWYGLSGQLALPYPVALGPLVLLELRSPIS